MATASSSAPRSSSSSSSAASKSQTDLLKKIRSHEIALAELGALSSSKLHRPQAPIIYGVSVVCAWDMQEVVSMGVYQRNGNIFFRTTVQKATASEQKELDRAKVELKRLNGS